MAAYNVSRIQMMANCIQYCSNYLKHKLKQDIRGINTVLNDRFGNTPSAERVSVTVNKSSSR